MFFQEQDADKEVTNGGGDAPSSPRKRRPRKD